MAEDEAPPDQQDHREVADAPAAAATGRTAALVARLKGSQRRAESQLERFEGRPVYDILKGIHERDRDTAGSVVGSAIAFRLFLFFLPLVLLTVGIAGFVSGYVSANDIDKSAGVSGTLADQVQNALSQPGASRWVATGLGLVGAISAGRSLSKVLWSASATAWRVPVGQRAPLRVVGTIAGLLAGIGLVSVLVNRARQDLGVGVASISFVAAFAIYLVVWLTLSTMLPRDTPDPAAALPGAILVATTICLMQAASQFYLPDKLSRASELYGAIGSTVVTLGWFFILGRVVVFSMTLNAVMYDRVGSVATFVFSLPGIRVIPRRSPRLRAFFGLDRPEETEPEPPPIDGDPAPPPPSSGAA